jgi:hypothetical protein
MLIENLASSLAENAMWPFLHLVNYDNFHFDLNILILIGIVLGFLFFKVTLKILL